MIEDTLADIEASLAAFTSHRADSKTFFDEETEELSHLLEREVSLRSAEEEQTGKLMKAFESEARFKVTKGRNGRKDRESEVMKRIDEVGFQMTLELAKGKKAREEVERGYANELADTLERIEGELERERRDREDGFQRL
jgi:hypothetical protein